MDLKTTKKDLKKGFDKKWKEITMKLQIDIKPEDLLSFDKMIAMPAIKVMYIIGLICIAIFGVTLIFDGTIVGFFSGIATLVVGAVIWRITCESAILLFGIYDRLGDIKAVLGKPDTIARPAVAAAVKVAAPATKKVKKAKKAKKAKTAKKA